MVRLRRLSILGALLAPLTTFSCGDNTVQVACGTGTVLTEGQCVPDGTVICEQGTVFDGTTGTCEVDPSACADGTVFLNGTCVPEDETTPMADLDEAAEPNDDAIAGEFAVPALDASTSIHGCITPRSGEADSDVWLMTATAPGVVEITADGVGGLAAGFVVVSNTDGLENYQRIGLNLTGDTSKRQVYLPLAGTYALIMDDSRSLLSGAPAGDADTCYYTTIKHVGLPAATALTLPATLGEDSGNVRVLTYTPGQEGDIFDVTQTSDSEAMLPAFVVLKNDQFYASATYDTANGIPPFYTVGGLTPTDTITVVIDEVYNYGLIPQAYSVDAVDVATQALPTDGTALTLTKNNGTLPATPWYEPNYSYLDVATADQIVHFALTSSASVTMRIVRADVFTPEGAYDDVAVISTSGTSSFTGEYVRFAEPGRYYFVTSHSSGTAGDTYTLTSTLTPVTAAALTYGTAATAQALPATGAGFHTLDLTSPDWIELGVTALNWGGNARVRLYDLAGSGWLGSSAYPAVATETQPADGSEPDGRITRGDTRDFLVRVDATSTPAAGATYDLLIRDRAHVSLGAIAAGTPITRTDTDTTEPEAVTRYLVWGTAGDKVRADVTPIEATVDVEINRLGASENTLDSGDTGFGGAPESVEGVFATPPWLAFEVYNFDDTTPTNLDTTFTVVVPPYAITTGTLAYADACANGGMMLAAPFDGDADDNLSAAQTLPFAFSFFGTAVNDHKISSNGFLFFGTTNPSCTSCLSNSAMPGTSAPNNVIAPYWDDLDFVTVCRKDSATSVTYQWAGQRWALNDDGDSVAFQVVVHSTGVIDVIYGAGQAGTSTSATVGVENATGTEAVVFRYNAAGVAPSTSVTFTPQP